MYERGGQRRFDWVDAAKGLCIVMVVLMHSTLGVEKALGHATWLHKVVDWAEPFRMPDFFLISGLFLAARIDRPWRSYVDTKIVHFAYFYLLWMHIHFAFRMYGIVGEVGLEAALWIYMRAYVEPFSALWFIYLLAVYFLVTKLLVAVPQAVVMSAAVALHMLAPHTGTFVVDEFSNRFVFFYAGYALAPSIFAYAQRLGALEPRRLLAGLLGWASLNTMAVTSGISKLPGADLLVSALGIMAVVAFSVLVVGSPATPAARTRITNLLLLCGRNSIVIYVAFTLFMSVTRTVLLKYARGLDGAVIALMSAGAGLTGALLLHAMVRGTRVAFLFERPRWARLPERQAPSRIVARPLTPTPA